MFADPTELEQSWKSFLNVVRVKSGEEWRVWPCCSTPVAVRLHWWRRRTVPCVASVGTCPACSVPARPLIYLGVRLGRASSDGYQWSPVRVLELPLSAWVMVKVEALRCGGLLACSFRVRRHGGARGKVFADDYEQVIPGELLSEREVVNALCRLWGIPAPRVGEVDADWLCRVGVSISCEGHYKPGRTGGS